MLFLLAYSLYRCASFDRLLSTAFTSGLSGAMTSYSAAPVVKAALDQLQMRLECCGNKGFRDWMTLDWKMQMRRRNGEGKEQETVEKTGSKCKSGMVQAVSFVMDRSTDRPTNGPTDRPTNRSRDLKQVTRDRNVVVDGWAGASNLHPHLNPHKHTSI